MPDDLARCPVCGGPLPDGARDCSPECRDARTGAPDRGQLIRLTAPPHAEHELVQVLARVTAPDPGWLRVASLLTWDDFDGIDGDD